jgi:hypothetical protein
LFLSGEVCLGVGCAVVVAAPTVSVVRRELARQKSAEAVVPAGLGSWLGRAERQVGRGNRVARAGRGDRSHTADAGQRRGGDGEFR